MTTLRSWRKEIEGRDESGNREVMGKKGRKGIKWNDKLTKKVTMKTNWTRDVSGNREVMGRKE